ncbi:uncharacterized protein APUU_21653S [Aspergillus puulaauensis]|uniref:Uncharacterized protein n=1 Tax=Aspergillus puulaauensis TaxID=1220207 RepID=A0A7R8AJJ6_9EURO|nr:uncharacterized protein APUU_21653S [Aspergillus puulaauensis]BCS21221.1 hypothetical protein APUU_21653S [Aspergillus puulaauensis]
MQFFTVFSAILATMVGVSTASPSAKISCLAQGNNVESSPCSNSTLGSNSCCTPLWCGADLKCHPQGLEN